MSVKIRNFYVRDIRNQVGASPIWPVSSQYNLGDYGYYSKRTGHFSPRGNLFNDLGLVRSVGILPTPSNPTVLNKIFNSSNTVKNEFTVNANVNPVKGKLELKFEGEKSYVFHLFNAEVLHLNLNDQVKQTVSDAQRSGKWDHRYRIIEMIYKSPDLRFAFSVSKDFSIDLSGELIADHRPSRDSMNYDVESSSNMDGSFWIENASSTPFVKLASFKRRELRFNDGKILIGDEWYLENDESSSFDDDDVIRED